MSWCDMIQLHFILSRLFFMFYLLHFIYSYSTFVLVLQFEFVVVFSNVGISHPVGWLYQICVATPSCAVSHSIKPKLFCDVHLVFCTAAISDCCCPWHCYNYKPLLWKNNAKMAIVLKCNKMLKMYIVWIYGYVNYGLWRLKLDFILQIVTKKR